MFAPNAPSPARSALTRTVCLNGIIIIRTRVVYARILEERPPPGPAVRGRVDRVARHAGSGVEGERSCLANVVIVTVFDE